MIKDKKAFTLVELLAVIVLLGIIMLLTFPKIIETVNNQQNKISKAKLSLMQTATKSYLADHTNQYPAREGNAFCISLEALEKGNYLAFDDEIDTNYVIKVSYFSDTEYEFSYVKATSCTESGKIELED
jgi:prepilin-type N-terminal cleavage/methylation domain-containing protein